MKNRNSIGEKTTKIYIFVTRRNLMKLACIAVLCISFAVSACDFRTVEAQTETNSRKDSNMESIQSATTTQHYIPPIDAVTAPEIETATFALG